MVPRIEAPTVAEHRAMRQRAVLDHAVDLLISQGPAALTPAAVAQRTGLARTSVYQYFPSSRDLLGAAIEELFVVSREGLDEALRAAGSDPRDRLAAYVRATLESARRGHSPTRLMGIELSEESRARLRRLHEQIAEPLVALVEASGASDVATTAALAQGVVNGAVALVERGGDLDAIAEATLSFLRRALYGS